MYALRPATGEADSAAALAEAVAAYPDLMVKFVGGDDPTSARFRRRPVGRVVCRLVEPGDVIVFASLAEAFPSKQDLVEQTGCWRRAGIIVDCLEKPAGVDADDYLKAFVASARRDSEVRSSWQRAIRARAQAQGRWLGPQPFGTAKIAKSTRPGVGHLLKPDYLQLQEAALCQYLRCDRNWTYSEIALELSRSKAPSLTPFDFQWKPVSNWVVSTDQVKRRLECPGPAVERFCPALALECREIVDAYRNRWREELGDLARPVVPTYFRLRKSGEQEFLRPPIPRRLRNGSLKTQA